MEENVKTEKIGFFKRLKIAVFKLEDYGMFLGERLSVAFKYLFILILLFSLIISIATTYDFFNMTNKMKNYIKNELPDFIYEEGKLHFDQVVEAYDYDYDFALIANTDENISEQTLKEYKNSITTMGMILLENKVIFISKIAETEIEENYLTLADNYQININNKSDLNDIMNNNSINQLLGTYFIVDVIVTYISNIITILLELCVVAIFGWIAARFCGINFKLSPMFSLSIYSLSLSIILKCAYEVVNIFTGFYIEYFNVIYLLIAYVYIIAAIFMIKYDLIKQTEELQKIIEVQKQVRKEMDQEEDKENQEEQEKKDDKKEKEDEEKKKEEEPNVENDREPDGSEI